MMLADIALATIVVAGVSTLLFGPEESHFWQTALPSVELAILLFVAGWVSTLWLNGAYRLRARWSIASEARVIVRSAVSFALLTFAFLFLSRLPDVSRLYLFSLFPVLVATTIVVRFGLRTMFGRARRRGMNQRMVLVLGTGELAATFATKLEQHPELGLQTVGFLGNTEGAVAQPVLGPLADFEHVLHTNVVDEVAICLTDEDYGHVAAIVRLCEEEGRIVRMPVPLPSLGLATSHVEDLDGTPVLSLVINPRTTLSLFAKRAIDIVGAAVGLVLLVPLFATIGAIIKLTDGGGPIFYRQDRVGLQGRTFRVVKFRSMVVDAEHRLAELRDRNELVGHAFKITDDPRITRIGGFLRRSSLDELPQLWNVLRGEMSLVGPRPPLPAEVAAYDAWHRRRLTMKPGITGLWQIEGRRETEFDRWVEKDLEYIDRWSPWLDITILLKTIPAVIRAEGR